MINNTNPVKPEDVIVKQAEEIPARYEHRLPQPEKMVPDVSYLVEKVNSRLRKQPWVESEIRCGRSWTAPVGTTRDEIGELKTIFKEWDPSVVFDRRGSHISFRLPTIYRAKR